jgi:hypothetical protein
MRMYVLFGTGWQGYPGIDRQLGRAPQELSLLFTGGRERHRARLAILSSRRDAT